MLQYERIDISEGIDFDKSDKSKERMILKNFMILNINGVDYRSYVSNISKNDAITLLNNSVLGNKGVL